MADRETLLKILDLARWAPSGDNTQPWRFEIVADDHIAVHGHDTRDWCVYDFDGHASHIAHGAVLETLRIAATDFGLNADWSYRDGTPNTGPIYDVKLASPGGVQPDPLIRYIETRTVQRRPMRMTPLEERHKHALTSAVGADYELRFFESFSARWQVAKLLWSSAYIRLTCPEAYQVHKEIIEWGARFSADRIPEQAVGVDPATAKLMRWVMQSWSRVQFFNRYLLGTVGPRVQLDLVPALTCAAHVLVRPTAELRELEDYVRLGVAMQRLWLTTTASGLFLQPEMTPVIFRWYVRHAVPISTLEEINTSASSLSEEFERIVGTDSNDQFGFLCRVGESQMPGARSVRKELADLLC